MSITSAFGFPDENLSRISPDEFPAYRWDITYAASMPVLPNQNAGTPQSSSAISIAFSLALVGFHAGSDIKSGFSAIDFS